MKGRYLIPTFNKSVVDRNIYADKSSLILEWILLEGINHKEFSLREVAQATGVGLGSVHRVFESLILKGFLGVFGIRTNKKFFLKNANGLLFDWIDRYNLVKKCKISTYSSGFQSIEEVKKILKHSELVKDVVLALHSSAEAHGCKNTNLQQLEIYLMKESIRPKLERLLKLFPKERGYEVLLIRPFYKSMLKRSINQFKENTEKQFFNSPSLLTFLDLYHFPLRGIEQAEFMAQRIPELKRIYKKGHQND